MVVCMVVGVVVGGWRVNLAMTQVHGGICCGGCGGCGFRLLYTVLWRERSGAEDMVLHPASQPASQSRRGKC
ncbi:hypothetical protein BZA77DRAFT_301860 [Pyronema omphalodes]|nr:hypothetical protein BZA77DRAFT_301860 [Pyronema omphalodes]